MLDESTDVDAWEKPADSVPATTHRWRVRDEILENYRGGSIVCRFRTNLPCLNIVRVRRSCAQMTDGTAAGIIAALKQACDEDGIPYNRFFSGAQTKKNRINEYNTDPGASC